MEEFVAQRKKSAFNASSLLSTFQSFLLPIARFSLLGLFIDDGIRVASQWPDQYRYVSVFWGGTRLWPPANALLAVVVLGQIVPCLFILFIRRAILPSCCALLLMVIYKSILYNVHYDLRFMAINISILGGLFMLISETQNGEGEQKRAIARGGGLPEPGLLAKDKKSKSILLLTGRLLLPIMFFSLLRWDPSNPLRMLELCVASLLMCLTIVGYQARLSAFSLALWLAFINGTANAWWQLPSNHPYREFSKFDFFQTLSVIGGLLLAFSHGPGQLSVDAYKKKNW